MSSEPTAINERRELPAAERWDNYASLDSAPNTDLAEASERVGGAESITISDGLRAAVEVHPLFYDGRERRPWPNHLHAAILPHPDRTSPEVIVRGPLGTVTIVATHEPLPIPHRVADRMTSRETILDAIARQRHETLRYGRRDPGPANDPNPSYVPPWEQCDAETKREGLAHAEYIVQLIEEHGDRADEHAGGIGPRGELLGPDIGDVVALAAARARLGTTPILPSRRHPTQPIERAVDGVVRFRANPIVRFLLDHGGINMDALAMLPFSDEDRAHFAQLIGYSVSGWGDLSYVAEGCPEWLAECDAEAARETETISHPAIATSRAPSRA